MSANWPGGVQVQLTLDFRFVQFSAWLDGWFVGNLKPRPHFPGLVGEADGAAVDGLGADALAASAALAAQARAERPEVQGSGPDGKHYQGRVGSGRP